MKKYLIVICSLCLFISGCGKKESKVTESASEKSDSDNKKITDEYNDPELFQQIKDQVYSQLSEQLPSDEYAVEDVKVIYLSEEEAENLSDGDQVFFGYNSEELVNVLESDKIIIEPTDSENEIESEVLLSKQDATSVIKNVAIGAGIIILCVTITILTKDVTIPNKTLTTFISIAPKYTATFASILGTLSSVVSGLSGYIKSGNIKTAFKDFLVNGSKGFKWGAIIGLIAAGGKSFLATFVESHNLKIPEWRESEQYVAKKLKAIKEQVTYCDGVESSFVGKGCSIIDALLKDNTAVEVKNYDLNNKNSLSSMLSILKREIADRLRNLPEGFSQKIVLDVRGRGYSRKFVKGIIKQIQDSLKDIYPNIPVEVIGLNWWPF